MERWTPRMRAVGRMFGIKTQRCGGQERARSLLREGPVQIGAGEIVLITGASGAGKSTLLRRIEKRLRRAGGWNDECRKVNDETGVMRLSGIGLARDRAVVDCFDVPLEEALAVLARAGLAEARLWLTAPARLSEGEQFRYRLARWMASEAAVLVADGFAENLDSVTARVAAWQLGRFVRASRGSKVPRAAVVATVREDLAEDLMPSVRVCLRLGERVEVKGPKVKG